MKINPEIFRAYDIRGIYPEQINEEAVAAIARAFVQYLNPDEVVLGRDARLSGPKLFKAITEALTESGVNVIDIGQCTTDMFYFTVGKYHYPAGIMITGSHNPKEYNGLKLVKEGVVAISSDSGLLDIRDLAIKDQNLKAKKSGKIIQKNVLGDYLNHILSFIDISKIKPHKIVTNPNFGAAGMVLDKLAEKLPIELVKLNFEPDGNFPKGRPDPYRPETRPETSKLVKSSQADFAVCWDADADRVFFFDEKGNWIEPCYITAVLIEKMLKKYPHEKIIYDPRVTWPVLRAIRENGGIPLLNKIGHTFFKERMRKENGLFTAESSGHYYFRENFFADNGMIPFLMILEELSVRDCKLSELVRPWQKEHATSGEINFEVAEPLKKVEEIAKKYSGPLSAGAEPSKIDRTDGLSVEYSDWRFNLRPSNTEPLLRLNIEARSQKLLREKKKELVEIISN